MPSQLPMQEVQALLGEDAVQLLCSQHPGKIIYIPKKGVEFSTQEEKESYIKNLFFEGGRSVDYIADKVCLTPGSVRRIINKR